MFTLRPNDGSLFASSLQATCARKAREMERVSQHEDNAKKKKRTLEHQIAVEAKILNLPCDIVSIFVDILNIIFGIFSIFQKKQKNDNLGVSKSIV